MKNSLLTLLLCSIIFFSNIVRAENFHICSTIRPIHALVKNVVSDSAESYLILNQPSISPHDYQLTPSDAKLIAKCDVIFLVSYDLEHFLQKAVKNLAKKDAKIVELVKEKGIHLLAKREHNIWHEDHDEHHHGDFDPHIWLDPVNAEIITSIVADYLVEILPKKSHLTLRKNASKMIDQIEALDQRLAAKLAAYQHAPFVVFHDAYQYFEKRYGLNSLGAIMINPANSLGAKSLAKISDLLRQKKVECIFKEPQFPEQIITNIAANTNAHIGSLDAEWGPNHDADNLYGELIENLADNFISCFENIGNQSKK